MQQNLQTILHKLIKENYDVSLEEIKLDTPPKKELGDFAFGAFVLAKELKKNPNQIAEEITEFLIKLPEIEFAKSEGPYVNIRLNKGIFTNKFLEIYGNDLEKKFSHHGKGKRIVIDYIGPNVGKPLHIGHMCTPNQGQAMINIYKKLGYDVISDSHIGDWGIIFGKLILAYNNWGDEKKLKENAINHLFELYVKVTEYIEEKGIEGEQEARDEFKKLSIGNGENVELWREFTSYSIDALYKELARLNVKADYDIGESFYEGLNLPKLQNYPDLKYNMQDVVNELVKKGIATKNEDNSVGVVFSEESKIPSCILQKRDGTHGYLASDLACVKYRMENWSPSKIVYFIDVRQQLHLEQVFEISKLAGWVKTPHPNPLLSEGEGTELFHAFNGFISLKDGAMSTRHGRIVKLEALLDEAENRAKAILETREDIGELELEKLAKIIGIGAIKYGYLKKSRENDVVFDWDEFMAFEGNSAPYIQYSYVRAIRILEKAPPIPNPFPQREKGNENFDTNEETDLIKLLLGYEDVLLETSFKNMPHILCKYAYDLTKAFSSFYNNIHILNEENEGKKLLRLKLVDEYARTLKDVFSLLAIEMPDRM